MGSDPRAGYFFQRSSVPPRSPLHYQLENGGATMEGIGQTMEGNQTDEYIHRQGSAIANEIEGPRGRNLDAGVSRNI